MFIQTYIHNQDARIDEFVSIEAPVSRKMVQKYLGYGSMLIPGAIQLNFQHEALFYEQLETDDLFETWLSLLESALTTKVDETPDDEFADGFPLSSDGYFLEHRIRQDVIEINHYIYGGEDRYIKKESINIPLEAYRSAVISGFNKFAQFIINANLTWAKESAYHRFMEAYDNQPNRYY